MDEPSKLTDEPNEAHFTSSDTIGDLISSLCGRAADSEIVNQSRINQTWKTRNSDGSITSSSEVGSEICDPVSRDHSVASIEVVEAVEEQTVPRNLGMAMDSACDVAIRAEDSDSGYITQSASFVHALIFLFYTDI